MSGPRTENRIVLIARKTRLDELIARFNTEAQARFYLEHMGVGFSDYRCEDDLYKVRLKEAQQALAALGRLQTVERTFLPNFLFGPRDTVVVLGQDGLVANTLKYLDGQPLLGVNPDPERWEGVLLPFRVSDLPRVLPEVFRGGLPVRPITMAQVRLNDGQTLKAVNDLFIGCKTHTSARYEIRIGGRTEYHSSSGLIVSTGLGGSGWLRSVLTGAAGIAGQLAGQPLEARLAEPFPWDAPYLYFSVREPWPSKTSSADITFGRITPHHPLEMISQMPEHGVIFSDGIEKDYLEFRSGMRALVSLAPKQGHLIWK